MTEVYHGIQCYLITHGLSSDVFIGATYHQQLGEAKTLSTEVSVKFVHLFLILLSFFVALIHFTQYLLVPVKSRI